MSTDTREALAAAWIDLPEKIRSHPGVKSLYRAAVAVQPASADMKQALSDILWSAEVNPSCQAGIVERCKCRGCCIERGRAALATQPAQPSAPGEFAGWQQRYIDPEEGPSSWQACSEDDARLLRSRTDYELRRTYAAQPSAQGEAVAQWMPIETAPVDGSKVLLNWKSGVVVGWYEKRTSNTHLSPWRRDLFGLRDTCYGAEPTHWMPLPTPPGHASAPAAPAQAVPLTESLLRELLEETREVFDADGAETPQSTRDVIEYMHSWLQVYADKSRGIKAAP